MNLVLSLFPGIDLFGEAFQREGFCVTRGPDILLGQDIRYWSAIPDKFDLVIGGPPCQVHSSVCTFKPSPRGNLIPEFERVVYQAQPILFIMENVLRAPLPRVKGYAIKSFILDSHEYGANQRRKRRFTFGWQADHVLQSIPIQIEEPLSLAKRTEDPFPTVLASEYKYPCNYAAGHKVGRRLTLKEVCELMSVPEKTDMEFLQSHTHSIFRIEFAYKLLGNAVEMKVGRVIARAAKNALKILKRKV